ncbi:Ger(x)C family spore germination protein [Aciduricibacillus chroicocephali]|uniref:Ger(X)C family spore germination protein n=1 Tax=Aciduricibacillus chroicocephali TaxID=3054939 RepID=A0ABY9L1D9_9BACI|nr:Ger(x)C family spore germination protein [Bacillaceae bacterium 44XB]
MTIKKCLLLLLSLLLLTGCWDSQEIEKRSYIVGIGLDKGENNLIKVTYLSPNPEFGAQIQGGGASSSPREFVTMEANDFVSSKNRFSTVMAKTVTYDQLQFIIVSEKLARDKKFIRYIYDAQKDVQIRRDVQLIVTDETPEKYFEQTKPKMEARVHKYFNLIIANIQQTGLAPRPSELLQYYRITESGSDLYLSLYTTIEEDKTFDGGVENRILAGELPFQGDTNRTEFGGAAVFKNGRMIEKITGDEVRIANLLGMEPAAENIIASYPDPFSKKNQLAVKINKSKKTKVRMNLKAEKPIIEVTVSLILEILSDHTLTSYQEKKNRDKLERSLQNEIKKEFLTFIKRTQNEFKAQPFGWSLEARKKFLTLQQYDDYKFSKKYPDMEVRVNVETRITDYGRQKNIPKIRGINK